MLILEVLPERQMGHALKTKMLVAAILGNSFYHKHTSAGKCYSGVLSLAY